MDESMLLLTCLTDTAGTYKKLNGKNFMYFYKGKPVLYTKCSKVNFREGRQ
jgi:hypothetical protein